MCDNHDPASEHSQGDKSFFAAIKAIVRDGDCLFFKNFLNVNEIDPVFTKVGLAFGFVPLKFRTRIVVTNWRYVNNQPRCTGPS